MNLAIDYLRKIMAVQYSPNRSTRISKIRTYMASFLKLYIYIFHNILYFFIIAFLVTERMPKIKGI